MTDESFFDDFQPLCCCCRWAFSRFGIKGEEAIQSHIIGGKGRDYYYYGHSVYTHTPGKNISAAAKLKSHYNSAEGLNDSFDYTPTLLQRRRLAALLLAFA